MPRQITVDWTIPSGTGGTTVLNFDATAPVASQRQAIWQWIDNMKSWLVPGTTAIVATSGKEYNNTTGAITGLWSHGTNYAVTGTSSTTSSVADATQGLVQFQTGAVVGRRLQRGRAFIPGISAAALSNGNLIGGAVAALNLTGPMLGFGLGVWHRPKSGAGGVFTLVSTTSVWSELAVLRRRRTP